MDGVAVVAARVDAALAARRANDPRAHAIAEDAARDVRELEAQLREDGWRQRDAMEATRWAEGADSESEYDGASGDDDSEWSA